MSRLGAHAGFFQIAYEGDFGSLYCEIFTKSDFLISNALELASRRCVVSWFTNYRISSYGFRP